jgi:predicted double-glycine peptidase
LPQRIINIKPAVITGWLYISVFFLIIPFLLFILPCISFAASISINTDAGRIQLPIKSARYFRDQGVVKQGFDYSCGVASLATLLTYGLGDPVSEAEILLKLLETLSKDEEALRKKEGLSLLDLQGIAQERGHKAQGFRLTPKNLANLKQPVIVFIRPNGYEHFAVLKGIRNDRVYLADPSLGNVRMPIYKFLDMWLDANGKGIIFVVERKDGQWAEEHLLKTPVGASVQPELLTIREMIEVGNPYVRYPHLSR